MLLSFALDEAIDNIAESLDSYRGLYDDYQSLALEIVDRMKKLNSAMQASNAERPEWREPLD